MLPTPSQSQELTGDQLKRVTSVPSIVECSYGADDAATGDVKQAAQSPPPRRNTSSTGLDTLAEADTPLDGEEPTPIPKISPRRVDTPEIGQPDFAAALDEPPPPPVASGYSPRRDVVRALRRKQALGLKTERLDSLQDTPQPSPVGKQDSMEEDAGKNKVEQPGFGEPWAVQRARVRRQSPIGDEESWNLVSCIVKSNDDLRQEVCALQIIAACDDAFRAAGLAGDRTGLWLKHYSIVPTGASTGIVEVMTDAVSLDSLKKSKGFKNVASHLIHAHGPAGSRRHARARRAFVSCVLAASFPSFLLPSAHRRAVGDGVAAMASRRRAVILASMAYPGDGVLVRRSRAKMVSGAMRRLSRTPSTRRRGDGARVWLLPPRRRRDAFLPEHTERTRRTAGPWPPTRSSRTCSD